jgi:hypothetical protein
MLLALLFSATAVVCSCSIPTFSASIVTLKFFLDIPEALMVFGKSLSTNFSLFAGNAMTENKFRPPGVRKSVSAMSIVLNVTWLLASLAQSSSSSSSELCDCRWWAPSSPDEESQDKEYDPSSSSSLGDMVLHK